jgi:hypothetical protein
MTFNIIPPSNVTNLFGNWLNGVTKKEKGLLELVYVLFCGLYGLYVMISSREVTHHILLLVHWIHMWSYLQLVRCVKTWILGSTV